MMSGAIGDLSVVFLASDGPCREEHWQDLLSKCPQARRVEGPAAAGSDYAAAAVRATTDFFILVAGDSVVDVGFFARALDKRYLDPNTVIVWPARNVVNELVSDRGGVRCWPRRLALREAGGAHAVTEGDGVRLVVETDCAATHRMNGSPYHAFRTAFREGVRLSLVNGQRVTHDLAGRLGPEGYRRLLTWMSVGADVDNGHWAMYGARLGCRLSCLGSLDPYAANDTDWIGEFWEQEIVPQFHGDAMTCERTGFAWDPILLMDALAALGDELRTRLQLPIAELTWEGSRFFRASRWAVAGGDRLVTPSMVSVLDRLGNVYGTGKAPPQDPAAARRLYRLAAGFGSLDAKTSLARMMLDGDDADPQEAVRLLTEASADGHAVAPYLLGRIYAHGLGVAADPVQALRYYRLAAGRGLAAAMAATAQMLSEGAGCRRDPVEALAFYEAAVQRGETVHAATTLKLHEGLTRRDIARARHRAAELMATASERVESLG